MKTVPLAVLQFLLDLPEEQPLRVVLNTNGRGEWKLEEVHLFHGSCTMYPSVELADLVRNAVPH